MIYLGQQLSNKLKLVENRNLVLAEMDRLAACLTSEAIAHMPQALEISKEVGDD